MSELTKPALVGGAKACDFEWPRWPVHGDAERSRLLAVLESGQWWFGERVREFEAAYAAFQGSRFAVTCTNGTTAIEMALRGLGVVEDDEVIVPPYTFIATASAAVTVGAIPVFADIQPDTLCLDPADVARKITPRTKAIIPVHVAGRMADMEAINALATEHRLVVTEDAAHAWGSQWRGRGAGTLGRCGTFSFQVSKNLTAGEGGIMVTDDEELADLCRSFTHCGRRKGSAWYDHDYLGSNLRMTEFQAAVLLAQLERLPEQLARREQNARLLDEGMRDLPGIRLLAPAPDMTRRSYHMFIFRVDAAALGLSRARFIKALQAEGLPVSEGWYRPLYRNGVFANAHVGPQHGIKSPLAAKGVDYREANCPVCEQVCRDAVWIPHPVLLAEEPKIQSAITAIRKVIGQAGSLVGGD
ncbi:MAG: DegT/DnrJ/EryC1/StrS family aminotransferase [Verrucomicrobiales bacterium]|nr:DegT/DnrJ/EryC1/StrS family aminotransferase [Verrucomicrobiales bacterium]